MLYRAKSERIAAATTSLPKDRSAEKIPAEGPHIRGEAKAPVTLEEFADFQCPPCAALSEIIKKLEEDFRGRLRVVFHHYPLTNHQHARAAAAAAEAAGRQGKFWEMHDLLYKNQSAWSKAVEIRPVLTGYGAALGLDVKKFTGDLDRPEISQRVTADQQRGDAIGVKQTPTIFINGEMVPVSSFTEPGLSALVEQALQPKATP